jgi:hypothetical protein
MTIFRNSAKCAHCGHELVSTHRHDYRTHHCEKAGKIRQQYNHDTKSYEPCVPFFAVDGGKDYIRRAFTTEADFIETSEYYDAR